MRGRRTGDVGKLPSRRMLEVVCVSDERKAHEKRWCVVRRRVKCETFSSKLSPTLSLGRASVGCCGLLTPVRFSKYTVHVLRS